METQINIKPLSYYQFMHQNRYRKYISKQGKEWRKKVEGELIKVMKGKEIMKKNVEVNILLGFKDKRANDVDNFTKTILDCMSEIVFEDDRQITKLLIEKVISDEYYIKISCREREEEIDLDDYLLEDELEGLSQDEYEYNDFCVKG